MSLPRLIKVRITNNGSPCSGVLIKAFIRVTEKNDFASFHGPSSEQGEIIIERGKMLLEANRDRDAFLMDYADPEINFSGTISLEVCTENVLNRAIEAHRNFGTFFDYPEGYIQMLCLALERIKQYKSAKFNIEVIAQDGDALLDVIG